MTESIPDSSASPRAVSPDPGGQLPRAANETCIDTAARQVPAVTRPQARTDIEAARAAGAAPEIVDDLVPSSPQSVTSVQSASDGSPGLQLTPPSDFGSGSANADLEVGLSVDGDAGSDEKATAFEGDDSLSLTGESLVVQLSVSDSTESSASFSPAALGGEAPPTETRRTFSIRCVAEYQARRCPRLEPGPQASAADQHALMNEIARLGGLLGAPGVGPDSEYPAWTEL
ncbi:hypothetical protein B0T14DRAFT_559959 [Immersiella caudata]|uniref:Uncharacterized protein n=1 Tax=Immersiella caudata TaxID=314043 RepID=A0AA39XF51_9PEZI|nr:hypothetical protein B0T14DRAFT_559959 [Immersiella caudata]